MSSDVQLKTIARTFSCVDKVKLVKYHTKAKTNVCAEDHVNLCSSVFNYITKLFRQLPFVDLIKMRKVSQILTSNHRQTGVNVLDLLNRLSTSSVKCWTVNFGIHSSKGPVIITHQLKSLYNSPLKNSYSHRIHTCFTMIASNGSYNFPTSSYFHVSFFCVRS